MVIQGDQAAEIHTFKVGFRFFYHYPPLRIFRPHLTPIEFQERSNGGPLQSSPGISLASLEELENRRWSYKETKPRRFTYSRLAFTFSTIAHSLEFPDRILSHRN